MSIDDVKIHTWHGPRGCIFSVEVQGGEVVMKEAEQTIYRFLAAVKPLIEAARKEGINWTRDAAPWFDVNQL